MAPKQRNPLTAPLTLAAVTVIGFVVGQGVKEKSANLPASVAASQEESQEHKRSAKWPKVRAEHLMKHPECLACGEKENLNVHHIVSFMVDPSLELATSNLCTLCTNSNFGGINCHHAFGHNFLWTCRNPNVVRDAKRFREMVDARLCNEEKVK